MVRLALTVAWWATPPITSARRAPQALEAYLAIRENAVSEDREDQRAVKDPIFGENMWQILGNEGVPGRDGEPGKEGSNGDVGMLGEYGSSGETGNIKLKNWTKIEKIEPKLKIHFQKLKQRFSIIVKLGVWANWKIVGNPPKNAFLSIFPQNWP